MSVNQGTDGNKAVARSAPAWLRGQRALGLYVIPLVANIGALGLHVTFPCGECCIGNAELLMQRLADKHRDGRGGMGGHASDSVPKECTGQGCLMHLCIRQRTHARAALGC
eukprot:348503-Pelagomonas_calceolata.AAC.4